MRLLLALVLASFLLPGLCSDRTLLSEPIPVELAVGARRLSERPVPSPDGSLLGYVVVNGRKQRPLPNSKADKLYLASGTPNIKAASELWIAELQGGDAFQINAEAVSSFAPSWSADGRKLAFYSDRDGTLGLWVWDRTIRRARRVSKAIARPGQIDGPPAWITSTQILAKFLPVDMTLDEAIRLAYPEALVPTTGDADAVTVSVMGEGQDAAFPQIVYGDLAAVDIETGEHRVVVKGKNIWNWSLAPGGSFVAYDTWVASGVSDFAVASLQDGTVKIALSKQIFGPQYAWSPDGKYLVYKSGFVAEYLGHGDAHTGHWTLLDTRNWKTATLSTGQVSDLAWAADGGGLYYTDDNAVNFLPSVQSEKAVKASIQKQRMVGIVRDSRGFASVQGDATAILVKTRDADTDRTSYYSVDIGDQENERIYEVPTDKGELFMLPVSPAGTFVFAIQDIGHLPDLWVLEHGSSKPQRLTQLNPELERYQTGQGMLVEWTDSQGRELKGALLLPSGYVKGKRYPLHVNVYGGRSIGQELKTPGLYADFSSQWNYQLLASRGYAVFVPEAPYGENTVLQDITDAVLSGIDRVVALGIADPQRLSVEGQSFGGYAVRALITQTTRFKAAISSAGDHGNLIAKYSGESRQHRVTADLYKDRDVLIENSPAFFYDQVRTPLLIQVGMNDGIGNNEQTYWDYRVLRRLGNDVKVLQYHGEGHALRGYHNQIDFWNRRIAWLKQH